MATVQELDARLQLANPVTEEEVDEWIQRSEVSNAGGYYVGDARSVMAAARRASHTIITKFLNNPVLAEVPLRRKTKFCLVLNNFALYEPVRPAVFESLDHLTNIFEKAIKEEGAMPFDSELGRMSEHVLVLLMRVTSYKLKASAVHEFAEGNTQFAIQLLLAILLKEPPYEFALRCNCISGLLGFTQPQAFFNASSAIEEHSCGKFTEKVDFMLNLMLRLEAIQVVSDVLTDTLTSSDEVAPITQMATNNTMRTTMNIFKFSSKDATQWRQHILLSTTFLDGTVAIFVQSLAATLQTALRQSPPRIDGGLLQSLNLAFKFGAFASYHLGNAASELRVYCTFFHDLFNLSIRPIVTDARLSGQFMVMYVNLLHFMCNVDAFAGEQNVPVEELLPELHSAALLQTVDTFLKKEVAACGLPFTQAWHAQFRRVDTDSLLAQETVTYQAVEAMFAALEQQLAARQQPAPAAPAAGGTRLLGEVPSLKPKQANKVSVASAAAPVKVHQRMQVAKKDVTDGVNPELLCALTGNVMKNPVSSPYGQTYEKESILSWLEQNGSVCPVTGKPLTAAQLTPNTAVAAKIMQQVVRQSMAAQSQASNDDDLYNF